MTSLPTPPAMSSLAPMPRISSSPSLPTSFSSLSVPKRRPPLLGQPGRSLVIKSPVSRRGTLVVRVPSHRASSLDTVAPGELPCSFLLEVSELVPEQPTASRRKAHPIRKAPTKAISCPWRTTAHPPSLCMHPLLLTSRSMPHNEPWCISTEAYSPKCVE